MSLSMHFAWYALLNHTISRKIICDSSYIFKELSYFVKKKKKKKNPNPTIFPIMLIIEINVIYVDNLHFLLFQII